MQSPICLCLKERPAHIKIQSDIRSSLLSPTCSVVCLLPQAYSNNSLIAVIEAPVSYLFVPWSAAERNGHIYVKEQEDLTDEETVEAIT